jgi:hypothetical protein
MPYIRTDIILTCRQIKGNLPADVTYAHQPYSIYIRQLSFAYGISHGFPLIFFLKL